MSFLNSVLSSIGSKTSGSSSVPAPATIPQFPRERSRENGIKVVNATGVSVQSSNKRSAEDSLVGPIKKSLKTHDNARSRIDTSTAPSSASTIAKSQPATSLARDDSRLQNKGNKPTLQSKPSADRTPSQNAVRPDANADKRKEPKKGSFAEIMARAKANQARPQAVGTINHKPKEKGALTFKKELKLQKQAMRDKALSSAKDRGSRHASSADEARRTGQASRKRAAQVAPVVKPKPQPAYKGTMNAASVTERAKEKAAAHTARRGNEYAGTDEELDEDDQSQNDDGYGIGDEEEDDESDDMEAGFSDVEQEETAADRAGRREDVEEAKLEARLKREKEERKRRVEELAKRAKPQRY